MKVLEENQSNCIERQPRAFKDSHVAPIAVNVEFLLEEGEESLRVAFVPLRADVVQTDLKGMGIIQGQVLLRGSGNVRR